MIWTILEKILSSKVLGCISALAKSITTVVQFLRDKQARADKQEMIKEIKAENEKTKTICDSGKLDDLLTKD